MIAFGFVGGFVTLSHIVVGLFSHHILGMTAFTANLVAYCAGFLLGYFGHRQLSFRSKAEIRKSMPKFFVISFSNLLVNQIIVYLFVNVAKYEYWVSLVVMVLTVPALTYLLSRLWAFSDGDFS
jgi:putative flippase GtrA